MSSVSDKSQVRHHRIAEDRAALLLGMPSAHLRRLSAESGVGRVEAEHLVFTYAELYRLCRFAAQSTG
jgi:hypothetical protein